MEEKVSGLGWGNLMIKFDDMTEILVNKDVDVSEKYKNIISVENMSDGDVLDFWNKEFEKAWEDAEYNDSNDFLSEIFDCSEDEIEIDFEMDDRILSILEKFDVENWDDLNRTEQISNIKELIKEVGEKLGLKKIPEMLLFEDAEGVYGAYASEINLISLNIAYFDDPKELVDTITHELRHAYQKIRAGILETREDRLFKCNIENYISPDICFTDYQDQYVEVDARAFASIFTEAMK